MSRSVDPDFIMYCAELAKVSDELMEKYADKIQDFFPLQITLASHGEPIARFWEEGVEFL
jgi:hypothetical protein